MCAWPEDFDFCLILENCSSRHLLDITLLRLSWEQTRHNEDFLPVDLPKSAGCIRQAGESSQPRRVLGENSEAGLCDVFGGSNHRALDFRNRTASCDEVMDSGHGKVGPELAWGVYVPGQGVTSDAQPTVDPIDTHRLLFYDLHEKQSSVQKFKAIVPVCSLT